MTNDVVRPDRAGPWRTVLRSPLLAELTAGVNTMAASAEFWTVVEAATTPLVEPIAGDPSAVCVTFLLRAPAASGPWTLCDGVSPAAAAEFELANLAGTDIWHVSLRLPCDTRVTYGFTRDVSPGSAGGAFDWTAHFAGRRADPYNPRAVHHPDQGLPSSPWGRTVSLLDLAAPARPARTGAGAGAGRTAVHEVGSAALGRPSAVHTYTPAGLVPGEDTPVVVLLDGWELVEIGSIAAVFDGLVAAGDVVPFIALMPDPRGHRSRDLNLSDAYCTFLGEELLAWAREHFGVRPRPATTVVGGASLGGLTAMYAAWRRPDVFGKVISLIGAFGAARDGRPDWLARQYAATERLPLEVYLAAGLLDDDVFPSGLATMLASNRHLRTVLAGKGYRLTYDEFPGGHDWVWLPGRFAYGLATLLGPPGAPAAAHRTDRGRRAPA
ncbi:DUF3327 domain-containing protein [Kitasatospora sp. RG8]|uniref:alpha/beta hydrolase n=1 Tax=Kitasatospora sp. RG8 TaxID=2820815 RepID=UPI001AE08F37|nr:alpha/beta hydrolase-fold protein [Kitasatospora sp. RG8]MBP0452344.1 DUF3327 domain-containing protein [Kitasatospora sp. RG8]